MVRLGGEFKELRIYLQRATNCREHAAVRAGLRPKRRGTRHVYPAGPAAAAPRGWNAAPPRSRASKTALSQGTDVNEGGAFGYRARAAEGGGRREGDPADTPLAAAPRLIGPAESSHSGFEASEGKGAEP